MIYIHAAKTPIHTNYFFKCRNWKFSLLAKSLPRSSALKKLKFKKTNEKFRLKLNTRMYLFGIKRWYNAERISVRSKDFKYLFLNLHLII